ncbi:MAG: ATP-dependent RecD-like DNA helicase [Lachnospiraceae bacterium]|nr:ATP-dependent RecD-like DNA helicase [Lachnospiraceae bacterium]
MDKLDGFVDHIIYQNSDNGYTILVLDVGGMEVTCVGSLKGIGPGETIEAEGEYVDHPVYGKQFKILTYMTVAPKDSVSIERYLASGAVKGVGAALASRIVKAFGEDTLRVIEEEPERLSEIKGISRRKAEEIAISMEEKKDLREAMIFLQQYGISNTLAVKIYNKYGSDMYGVMRENPYRLAEDIPGVGFRIADEIASKIGIKTDSDYRIRCGIFYAMSGSYGEGHCYLPTDELVRRSAELLDISEEYISPQLSNLVMDKKLVIKGDKAFSSQMYYTELNCAALLHNINNSIGEMLILPSEDEMLKKKLTNLAEELEMELDGLQLDAALKAIKNGVSVISGGPGTGKTTTINLIIKYFESENMDLMLAAPTGRAAKRMTEATGVEAKTIHRMLELNAGLSDEDTRKVTFERNQENPLETDVIIIDEMSMVDVQLFLALLKAVMPGTRLILVGDVNQLPSVGPGQVLRDIMESKAFPTTVLNKVFRQSEGSDIVMNAHRINNGIQINPDNKSKDFFLLERNDVNVIYKHMVQLITEKLPGYVNATPFDIQVLTPMRKGNLGCETLNSILQEYLNPQDGMKKEYAQGEKLFRVGDKVMQIKNNYNLEWEILGRYNIPLDKGLGVFNGDMGIVREINENAQTLTVEFDEHKRVTYPFLGLEELELSYAVTIHKSQGSEYPAVVLPLLSGPRMLFNRNLLYTAITRAKKCVTILGSKKTLSEMIDNQSENKRYTDLLSRIREATGDR